MREVSTSAAFATEDLRRDSSADVADEEVVAPHHSTYKRVVAAVAVEDDASTKDDPKDEEEAGIPLEKVQMIKMVMMKREGKERTETEKGENMMLVLVRPIEEEEEER